MPEGFAFSWLASDGHHHSAPLLTPPDFEAVQREDGSWYRVPRMTGDSVPISYSKAWFKEYLRTYGLPAYFLRPRHLSMLLDNQESEHLQVPNTPSPSLAVAPSRDYLQRRYFASALWPQAGTTTYRLESLSEGTRASLVRHHSALLVTKFTYNIFIHPDGHIELRMLDEALDCPTVSENDIHWIRYNEGAVVPSSYHQESTGLHALSHAHQSSSRDALIQAVVNQHAVVNPMEDIPGLGELTFLSEGDRLEAEGRGYASAHEVSMARRRGDLAVGTGTNAGPLVVFRPIAEMLNPRKQPQGPGAWRFLTSTGETSNAGLAAIQFGGSRGLPAYPSARQIRRLGEMFQEAGRTDLTRQIDIVWVPDAEDGEIAIDPFLEDAPESEEEQESSPSDVSTQHASAVTPPYTSDGLVFDPTNNNGVRGGVDDQTGEFAEYQTTLRHGGRSITIDRSRAWYGHPEPHKLWCYSHRGWRKWVHWHSMDWEDKSKVNALNKHREQTHQRARWPSLRAVKRPDYQLKEKKFVMGYIQESKGERSAIPMKKLTDEFHRRFIHRTRNDTGMQSLVDRLRTEYRLHGGLMARKKRGWKQREQSRKSRGLSLGSEQPEQDDCQDESEARDESEVQEQSELQEQGEALSREGGESEEEGNEAEGDQMMK